MYSSTLMPSNCARLMNRPRKNAVFAAESPIVQTLCCAPRTFYMFGKTGNFTRQG
jgi:hypothetical protein